PGGDDAPGLVQGQGDGRGGGKVARAFNAASMLLRRLGRRGLAGAGDLLAVEVDPGERVGDDPAVDAHGAGADPVPGLGARAPAQLGHGAVQLDAPAPAVGLVRHGSHLLPRGGFVPTLPGGKSDSTPYAPG